ncbi:MAG TPA: Rieske 2Fe-2S domain-containing protein [Polyangiaceae bacterium]|nr:Rieske 2Fe-2S domain-containing protein [Polyangiaceae bacterium]
MVRLAGAAGMAHGETQAFSFHRYGGEYSGFLLCYQGGFEAYANNCPHWNVDLDLGMGRFFDERFDAIVCRNHGALFTPATGLCRAGPCVGASLERFKAVVDGADVVVHIPAPSLVWGADQVD